MAILPGIRGAKVEIIMNGTARREYNDRDLEEDLNEYEIERYIEAIPGQVFSVRIELLPDFMHESNCLRCRIFVDGALVDAPLLLKADADSIFISEGNELDGGMVEKYRFASPETVSDGRINSKEASRAKELGTIRIECEHVHAEEGSGDEKHEKMAEATIVSEKALKERAIDHTVEFTDAEELSAGPATYWETDSADSEYISVLVFHYRSLAALKSMLIIPRTPSPAPLEEREAGSLSQDEIKELQRQFLAMRGEKDGKVKIKREKLDENPRPRKVSKPSAGDTQLELDDEGGVRESSTATLERPEVIELD